MCFTGGESTFWNGRPVCPAGTDSVRAAQEVRRGPLRVRVPGALPGQPPPAPRELQLQRVQGEPAELLPAAQGVPPGHLQL